MGDLRVCSAELVEAATRLCLELSGKEAPLALLANNGMTALVGRSLANQLAVPLVPVNPLLTPGEISHILLDSGCTDLLVEAGLETKAEGALRIGNTSTPMLQVSDLPPLAESDHLHFAGSTEERFTPKDIGATLIYTSGTTGTPKGCMRSAEQEYARASELIQSYSLTPKDQQLLACPLAHSAPGILVRAAHAIGASSIIMRRFQAEPFWRACTRHGATFFFLVPTQYRRLLEACQAEAIPDTLRVALVAGAPLPAKLHGRILAWLGPNRLWQFYGSSETGTIAIAPPSREIDLSVGVLAPSVELEIRAENGELCPRGSIGEMFVRSPTVMSGYRGHPRPVDRGGFVSVGDLGYQDEAGRVFLVDRKHDTIISGGVNVYPAEVEAALLAHPQVRAAVVVGLQDEDWGQRVVALVATSEACTAAALREHCLPILARYKIPKEFYFYPLEEMPVGASGKPLRRSARAMLL